MVVEIDLSRLIVVAWKFTARLRINGNPQNSLKTTKWWDIVFGYIKRSLSVVVDEKIDPKDKKIYALSGSRKVGTSINPRMKNKNYIHRFWKSNLITTKSYHHKIWEWIWAFSSIPACLFLYWHAGDDIALATGDDIASCAEITSFCCKCVCETHTCIIYTPCAGLWARVPSMSTPALCVVLLTHLPC